MISPEKIAAWPEHASPLPWKYVTSGSPSHRVMADWIEDATGGIVVENVGHIDGPAIVAAVNSRSEFLILRTERDEADHAIDGLADTLDPKALEAARRKAASWHAPEFVADDIVNAYIAALAAPPQTEPVTEAVIDAVMEVERYSPKTFVAAGGSPIFDGMALDTDGPWVSRVAVAKKLRAALFASVSREVTEEMVEMAARQMAIGLYAGDEEEWIEYQGIARAALTAALSQE